LPTNLAIDDGLLEQARRIGKRKTKRETVNTAFEEYIAWRKQLEVLSLIGSIHYDPQYRYKQERSRRRK
jgi:hypothetical protein